MTINGFRLGTPDIAYIGAGVTVKGAIVVPDAIVVDGVVEGDVTAQSIRIGPSGAIKGNVILFAHGHVLRVFAARWLGLSASEGQRFLLDTATMNILSFYRGIPAVKRWNAPVQF